MAITSPAEWVRRGELVATPLAVNPGTVRDSRWLRWERAQLQAWGWGRVHAYTGGRVELAVDLGCGYGDWAERLATIAARVVAIDVAPGFAAQTRARLDATGHQRCVVACHDIRDFAAYDHADLVHLGGVLTYLDDADTLDVLSSVRARLTRRGVVHQRDWCAINLGRPSKQTLGGLFSAHRSPAQYVTLARRAGLRLLEQKRAASIYAEQLHVPSLLFRIATAYRTRGSVSFFFARCP